MQCLAEGNRVRPGTMTSCTSQREDHLWTWDRVQWTPSTGFFMDRAQSPAQSYKSMTSDGFVEMYDDSESPTRIQLARTDSYSSCYSWDSDDCEKRILKVKIKEETVSEHPDTPEEIQDSNEFKHPSVTVKFTFEAISNTLGKLSERALTKFKTMLCTRCPRSFHADVQYMDMVNLVDRLLECHSLASLNVTVTILEEIGEKKMAADIRNVCVRNEVRYDLSETLKREYGEMCVNMDGREERRPFDDIYANLYISSTCDNGPNIEHEVMTIEKLDSNQEPGKPLSTEDIFTTKTIEWSSKKLMLMTGVAGSGKSMAVRRLILDWAKGQSHHDVSFIFPLSLKELKQFEGSTISLLEIIQTLYPEAKKLRNGDFRCEDCKIMFILDGIDEYNEVLDFYNTTLLSDPTSPATLNIIVVNLLRGRLVHHGLLLVTSRPQVRSCIPWDTHYDEMEVRGFCDPYKDEYFNRRFKDPDQAAQVLAYINSVTTLRIMCHLPLFCSLIADEYDCVFRKQGTRTELPRSITYMYTKLMLELAQRRRGPECSSDKKRDLLMNLGKMALEMLEQHKFKVAMYDWKNTEMEEEAVNNSGLCMEYLTKPLILFDEKMLSFIHPTVQEYMAALYAFLSFTNEGKNIFEEQLKGKGKFRGIFKVPKVTDLYKAAVDRSLSCADGKLDIFLRFLCGMACRTNLELLQPFLTSSAHQSSVVEDVAALIRKRMREKRFPGRNDNLQRCLAELGV
uniref:protein NLRC3 isoform X2 n=1 Tax=Solea senegalensis TaxID=28829 RepID=UPI001CD82FF5|nr:protein NLRC3 isoform X2 [Solea senegalensis]